MNPPGHPVTAALGRAGVLVRLVSLLCSVPALAQRVTPTLGPVIELPLDSPPASVAVLRRPGAAAGDCAVAGEAGMHLYTLTRDARGPAEQAIEGAVSAVAAADLNGDRRDDLVALAADPPALHLLMRSATGFRRTVIPLGEPAGRILVADANNDGRPDVLLFGRTSVGVRVFRSREGGTFAEAPRLFPEISVSALVTADLNGDGIDDIVLAEWLHDRVISYYGIGRGAYTEQSVLDLSGEPSDIAVTAASRSRTWTAAISLSGRPLVAVYEGNARGELRPRQEFHLPAPASRVSFTRLNPDPFPELVALSAASVTVFPAASPGLFSGPVVFGPGRDLVAFAAGDLDGDGRIDVAALDRASRRLVILGNAHGEGPVWPSVYAAGVDPRGLTVRDVDGDGRVDILVANRGSSQLSFFRGKERGGFTGQEAVSVAPEPLFLRAPGRPGDPARTIIASHGTGDNISISRFDSSSGAFTTSTIPTGAQPYVLLAREDRPAGPLQLLVRYRHGRNRTLSLSLIEQAGERQFIERSLRPATGSPPLGLTVGDAPTAGRYELLLVTRDERKAAATLSVAAAGEEFDFPVPSPLLAFPDPAGGIRSILTGFLDGDEIRDILLVAGEPRNAIGILFGRQGNAFADSLVWITGVLPAEDDAVLLVDADGNGTTDIVLPDRLRDAVILIAQNRGGGFRAPAVVASVSGVTGMRIAPLRSSLRQDLVLARGEHGTVSVLFDFFPR